MQLSTTEAAYVAGIIDGEGCLQAHMYDRLKLRVEVGSTCRALPEWLAERIGGTVRENRRRQPGWRPLYMWRIDASLARELLPIIVPHLIVKRRQAELFLELAELRADVPRGRRLSEGERARRLSLVEHIAHDKRKVA